MGIQAKRSHVQSFDDLKKEGLALSAEKVAYEKQLVEAFNAKKLKSERLISEAKEIIKASEKKASKNKNKTV